jgi:DNA-binding transcriptional ArsR family regulator
MEDKQAVAALSALAQDSRLRVFRLLVRSGPDGLAAGEISEELSIPPATLSFHLMHLTQAGLTESKRRGRSILYALRVEGIQGLLEFLTADCCQGRPELCGSMVSRLSCGPCAESAQGRKGTRS